MGDGFNFPPASSTLGAGRCQKNRLILIHGMHPNVEVTSFEESLEIVFGILVMSFFLGQYSLPAQLSCPAGRARIE
jgi:hypothetical protein